MTDAYVLMTAMPPTTGHYQLIEFAKNLADRVWVLFTTQPDEPLVQERLDAVYSMASHIGGHVYVKHYAQPMDPNPESEGFRHRWAGIMIGAGAKPGDLLVISERWGQWLAEMTGMDWRPYDIERSINGVKATRVRERPHDHWRFILPAFRKHLQVRVTIYGAESTGKTTLSKGLGYLFSDINPVVLPEYARPYLENTVNEITERSMTAIWEGQRALQRQSFVDHPLIIQDTDLWSTWGYWNYFAFHDDQGYAGPPNGRLPIPPPDKLSVDARELRSDLYIMPPSVLPFAPDPLRYGGDHREILDEDWIRYGQHLPNLHVLGDDPTQWTHEASRLIDDAMEEKAKLIAYDRHGY